MIEVIPAILPTDFADLSAKLSFAQGMTKLVQIDTCDAMFVPSQTFPFGRGDAEIWQKIVVQDEGLPLWDEFDFEADLMVRHPVALAREWIAAGASRIIVHLGSDPKLADVMAEIRSSIPVGLALRPGVEEAKWLPLLGTADFAQVMGIAAVGFQGQPFEPAALVTIAAVRKAFPAMPIAVDGAVSVENAKALVAAGATRLVAGSAIFNSSNPRATIRELSQADGSVADPESDLESDNDSEE